MSKKLSIILFFIFSILFWPQDIFAVEVLPSDFVKNVEAVVLTHNGAEWVGSYDVQHSDSIVVVSCQIHSSWTNTTGLFDFTLGGQDLIIISEKLNETGSSAYINGYLTNVSTGIKEVLMDTNSGSGTEQCVVSEIVHWNQFTPQAPIIITQSSDGSFGGDLELTNTITNSISFPNWTNKAVIVSWFQPAENKHSEFSAETNYFYTTGTTAMDRKNYALTGVQVETTPGVNTITIDTPTSQFDGGNIFSMLFYDGRPRTIVGGVEQIILSNYGVSSDVFCFIGTDCYVDIMFNEYSEFTTSYLDNFEDGLCSTDTHIASTTLQVGWFDSAQLQITNETVATSTDYCIINDNPRGAEYGNTLFFTAHWTATGTPFGWDYDIDSVCDDIATTTNTFFYGIECGFRKVIFWTFTPRAESIQKINDAKTSLFQSFPFSVYRQGKELFEDVASSTASTTAVVIRNPIGGDQIQVIGGQDDSLAFISTSAWTIIRNSFVVVIYFLGVIYFIFRFINISKGKNAEE